MLKISIFHYAIRGAASLGSFKFALYLLEKMENYFKSSELREIINTYPNKFNYRNVILARTKKILVLSLSQRGDIDAAHDYAIKLKVHFGWIIGGQILSNNNNFTELERELDTSITKDSSHYVIKNLILNKMDILWNLLNKYPQFARTAANVALHNKDIDLFMEIINHYPVIINNIFLGVVASYASPELFETIHNMLQRPLNSTHQAMILQEALNNIILFDYLLDKFNDNLYNIILIANEMEDLRDLLPILGEKGIIKPKTLIF